MTTLDATQLSPTLQALVDARLDTIERMLMGKVPRLERLAIVREVESQIQEQLGERQQDELSREDVIAVLASLDPPEAYLPDEDQPASHVPRLIPAGLGSRNPARSSKELAGGVLGLLSLIGAGILPVLCWIPAMMIESVEVLVGGLAVSTVLVLTLMTISLVLSIRAGLRKPWAVTGLVAGLCGGVLIVLITGASLFLM